MRPIAIGLVAWVAAALAHTSPTDNTNLLMSKLAERVEIYALRHGRYPTTAEGLAVVFQSEPVPHDGWGGEIRYVAPGPNGAPFDLVSYGSDGRAGGGDGCAARWDAADLRWSEVRTR